MTDREALMIASFCEWGVYPRATLEAAHELLMSPDICKRVNALKARGPWLVKVKALRHAINRKQFA